MRKLLWVGLLTAAALLPAGTAEAYEGPWCAGTNRGGGTFVYNCSMRTLEQCIPEVIAGNRGFCSPNPYYRPEPPPRRGKRQRYSY